MALDEPGCGRSDPRPPGAEYSRWSTIIEMKRVVDYMSQFWSDKKIVLMGHAQGNSSSWPMWYSQEIMIALWIVGGHYCLLFAAIFPQRVQAVILLDIFKPIAFAHPIKNWINRIPHLVGEHFKTEKKFTEDSTYDSSVHVFAEGDAMRRVMEFHADSLTERSARILMIRGCKQMVKGFTFSRDMR